MIVIATIVDQQRLERLEEQAGGIADVRGALALFAHGMAQLPQNQIGAGGLLATQYAAFELADQQRTRLRR